MQPPTTSVATSRGQRVRLPALLVALLLFGRRLPEVARSLGRSIVEFKRGLRDLEHEIESASEPEPHETKQGGPTLPEDSQSQTDSSRSEQREQQS